MTNAVIAAVVLLGVGAAGYSVRPAAPANASAAVVEVTVAANCADTALSSVNPDPVDVNQGDEIDWTLEGDDADSLQITPKRAEWPFAARRHAARRSAVAPGAARRPAVARARGMRGNQRGGRFGYNVTVFCGDVSHVIDPDIIVH